MMLIDGKVVPVLATHVLEPFRDAGVTAMNVPVSLWEDHAATRSNIDAIGRLIASAPDRFALLTEAPQFEERVRDGRLGLMLSVSSTAAYDGDVGKVSALAALGVRIAQPAFLATSIAGSSCTDPVDEGLTARGAEFVESFEENGVAIDLSHVGQRTARDVIKLSSKPVFYSQAAPATANQASRNKPDDAVREIAGTGGVACVAALRQYLPRAGRSTVDDIVTVVLHWLDVAGEDHVGIGSDLTPGQPAGFYAYVARAYGTGPTRASTSFTDATPGFVDPRGYDAVATGLARAGVASRVIEKVMGRNLQRFFADAWRR